MEYTINQKAREQLISWVDRLPKGRNATLPTPPPWLPREITQQVAEHVAAQRQPSKAKDKLIGWIRAMRQAPVGRRPRLATSGRPLRDEARDAWLDGKSWREIAEQHKPPDQEYTPELRSRIRSSARRRIKESH